MVVRIRAGGGRRRRARGGRGVRPRVGALCRAGCPRRTPCERSGVRRGRRRHARGGRSRTPLPAARRHHRTAGLRDARGTGGQGPTWTLGGEARGGAARELRPRPGGGRGRRPARPRARDADGGPAASDHGAPADRRAFHALRRRRPARARRAACHSAQPVGVRPARRSRVPGRRAVARRPLAEYGASLPPDGEGHGRRSAGGRRRGARPGSVGGRGPAWLLELRRGGARRGLPRACPRSPGAQDGAAAHRRTSRRSYACDRSRRTGRSRWTRSPPPRRTPGRRSRACSPIPAFLRRSSPTSSSSPDVPRPSWRRCATAVGGGRLAALVAVDVPTFAGAAASPASPALLRAGAAGVPVAVVRAGDDLSGALAGAAARRAGNG